MVSLEAVYCLIVERRRLPVTPLPEAIVTTPFFILGTPMTGPRSVFTITATRSLDNR